MSIMTERAKRIVYLSYRMMHVYYDREGETDSVFELSHSVVEL